MNTIPVFKVGKVPISPQDVHTAKLMPHSDLTTLHQWENFMDQNNHTIIATKLSHRVQFYNNLRTQCCKSIFNQQLIYHLCSTTHENIYHGKNGIPQEHLQVNTLALDYELYQRTQDFKQSLCTILYKGPNNGGCKILGSVYNQLRDL